MLKPRIARVKHLRVFCKCLESLEVSGTPGSCKDAVKQWARGHVGRGHGAITRAEWRRLKRARDYSPEINSLQLALGLGE